MGRSLMPVLPGVAEDVHNYLLFTQGKAELGNEMEQE